MVNAASPMKFWLVDKHMVISTRCLENGLHLLFRSVPVNSNIITVPVNLNIITLPVNSNYSASEF